MTTQLKNFLNVILLVAAVCFASCTGKDGDPGPSGTNGTNGTNGTDGVGFDEAVKDGNIVATFSGKRPDNVSFTAEQDFKFSPDGDSPSSYSTVYKDTESGTLYFRVTRYLGAVITESNNNYITAQFQVTSDGVVTPTYFFTQTTIVDGTKFFSIYQYDYPGDGGNGTMSDYSYDSATGHLKFKFSVSFPQSSSTGYDLSLSGVADLTVYEDLNPPK